jgi:hypothetical protein
LLAVERIGHQANLAFVDTRIRPSTHLVFEDVKDGQFQLDARERAGKGWIAVGYGLGEDLRAIRIGRSQ